MYNGMGLEVVLVLKIVEVLDVEIERKLRK